MSAGYPLHPLWDYYQEYEAYFAQYYNVTDDIAWISSVGLFNIGMKQCQWILEDIDKCHQVYAIASTKEINFFYRDTLIRKYSAKDKKLYCYFEDIPYIDHNDIHKDILIQYMSKDITNVIHYIWFPG